MNATQHRKYAEILDLITPKGWILLTETYVNAKTPIPIRCNQGHHIFKTLSQLNKLDDCEECHFKSQAPSQIERYNDPRVAEAKLLTVISQKGGTLKTRYEGNKKKVQIRCADGHIFEKIPNTIIRGQWCRVCSQRCSVEASREFNQILQTKKAILLTPYIRALDKVEIQCEYGHNFKIKPHDVKSGYWCIVCSGKDPITAERTLRERIGEYQGRLLSPYINTMSKVSIQCTQGHIFHATPNHIKSRNQWCSICNQSIGELLVYTALTQLGFTVYKEYRMRELPNYKYDFLFCCGDKWVIIEFDGEQHFRYVDHFHENLDEFTHKQDVDVIKTEMAIGVGYQLIRIDYTYTNKSPAVVAELISGYLDRSDKLCVSNQLMYSWLVDKISPNLNTNLSNRQASGVDKPTIKLRIRNKQLPASTATTSESSSEGSNRNMRSDSSNCDLPAVVPQKL